MQLYCLKFPLKLTNYLPTSFLRTRSCISVGLTEITVKLECYKENVYRITTQLVLSDNSATPAS